MNIRTFKITAAILAAVITALVWLNITVTPRTPWDACYDIPDSRIEWSGAGYDGIYMGGKLND